MLIFDSHCDSPSQMYRMRDFNRVTPWGHVDFSKMRAGGVGASFFALYTFPDMSPADSTAYALKLLSGVYDQVDAAEGGIEMAFSSEELLENKSHGLISILLALENGAPIQKSLSLLRMFYRMGVLCVTLTHNADNEIGDSCAGNKRWGGLSPFGREVVAEMNRLGMIIDIAHASDDTVRDCLEVSRAPIVSTHSCCRALAHHRRNLTDDQIRAIADKGGVVQINFCPSFLSDEFDAMMVSTGIGDRVDEIEEDFKANPSDPERVSAWVKIQRELKSLERPSYKAVVDHIDHAVSVGGINHVGIGSDYDGICVLPEGLEDISRIGVIFEEMRERGYSKSDVSKVAGGNMLRVLKDVEAVAASL